MERKIRVISQRLKETFVTSAVTFGEFAEEMAKKGITLTGVKAVSSIGMVTLEVPETVLPDVDFSIHLFPIKIKAGAKKAMTYDEAYLTIKEINEKVTANLKVTKNHVSSLELKNFLSGYSKLKKNDLINKAEELLKMKAAIKSVNLYYDKFEESLAEVKKAATSKKAAAPKKEVVSKTNSKKEVAPKKETASKETASKKTTLVKKSTEEQFNDATNNFHETAKLAYRKHIKNHTHGHELV